MVIDGNDGNRENNAVLLMTMVMIMKILMVLTKFIYGADGQCVVIMTLIMTLILTPLNTIVIMIVLMSKMIMTIMMIC